MSADRIGGVTKKATSGSEPCRPERGEHDTAQTPAARPNRDEALAAVETLLRWAGDDPNREGLLGTPDRVVKAYEDFFRG